MLAAAAITVKIVSRTLQNSTAENQTLRLQPEPLFTPLRRADRCAPSSVSQRPGLHNRFQRVRRRIAAETLVAGKNFPGSAAPRSALCLRTRQPSCHRHREKGCIGGVSNIVEQPVDGRASRQPTHFSPGRRHSGLPLTLRGSLHQAGTPWKNCETSSSAVRMIITTQVTHAMALNARVFLYSPIRSSRLERRSM
jgi:hypothetical protein